MLGLERHAPHRKEGSTEPAWGMKVHGWHGDGGRAETERTSMRCWRWPWLGGSIGRPSSFRRSIDPPCVTMRTRRRWRSREQQSRSRSVASTGSPASFRNNGSYPWSCAAAAGAGTTLLAAACCTVADGAINAPPASLSRYLFIWRPCFLL